MAMTGLGTLESASPRKRRRALKKYLLCHIAECERAVGDAYNASVRADADYARYLETIVVMERQSMPTALIRAVFTEAEPSRQLSDDLKQTLEDARRIRDGAQCRFDKQFPPLLVQIKRWFSSYFSWE
jgi:hypothetical protein